MDAALLREREAFKKKALVTPSVETKKPAASKNEPAKKKSKPSAGVAGSSNKLDVPSYKSMSGSSQYRFSVLAKIVKYMKTRHKVGDDYALALEEILDETNQLDVGAKVKQWLLTDALPSNPKITVTQDGKFIFKPPYNIRDRKSLLRLLKNHDLKGHGGILLEDVQESLPNYEKALRLLQNDIIYITRPMDKKKVMFYNDKTAQFGIDEEFVKLWRGVPVKGIDENKIDEYLEKQGLHAMQDHGMRKLAPVKRRATKSRKKGMKKPRDNEHMADVLESYDERE